MEYGVYKSADGGASWSQVNSGLKDLCVYTLAVDPNVPAVVYAGTTGNSTYCKTFSGKPDHVYKTENGGSDWKVVLEGKTISRGYVREWQGADTISPRSGSATGTTAAGSA